MDGGAWWAAVHGVAKSWTRLSDFTFTFHFHALEKEMATHCSVLAWRIPGMGEPGGLPSVGSHRVGHDWRDLAAAAAAPVKTYYVYTHLLRKTRHLSSRSNKLTDSELVKQFEPQIKSSYKMLKENNYQHRIWYPLKVTFSKVKKRLCYWQICSEGIY